MQLQCSCFSVAQSMRPTSHDIIVLDRSDKFYGLHPPPKICCNMLMTFETIYKCTCERITDSIIYCVNFEQFQLKIWGNLYSCVHPVVNFNFGAGGKHHVTGLPIIIDSIYFVTIHFQLDETIISKQGTEHNFSMGLQI